MTTPIILSLRCPGCGAILHGTPQGVLLWCEGCGGLLEVVGDRFVPRPVKTARPLVRSEGRAGYLPLWEFRVRVAWELPEQTRRMGGGWKAPDRVYVTGFAVTNGSYFGDPGLIFTQKGIALSAGDPAPLIGGTRGLDAAKAFVEPHLLGLLDRRVDVTGVEMGCTIDEAAVWAVPYFDDGLTLRDGILGLELPGAALDEIGALRAWWGRRG